MEYILGIISQFEKFNPLGKAELSCWFIFGFSDFGIDNKIWGLRYDELFDALEFIPILNNENWKYYFINIITFKFVIFNA